MKNLLFITLVVVLMTSCTTTKSSVVRQDRNENKSVLSDTVRIINKDLDYEVIIFEPGFNSWLTSQAQPRGFYSERYLENKNRIYVSEYNNRVTQPFRYSTVLYQNQINYNFNIHYGYEVNYLIYNYLVFFQLNYKQQLAGFVPRN